MGFAPLLIAVMCICPIQVVTTIDSDELLSSAQSDGKYLLPSRFQGKFTRQFSDLDEVRLPFADAEYEFTHVEYLTRSEDNKNQQQRVWIRGQKTGAGITPQTSSASFGVREFIPDFETLKGLESIQDFERELGPLGSAIDAWGSNGVWHSSKHWRGCMIDGDGNMRGVQVFLHTVDHGDGWEIEHRHVYEGVFRPTTESKAGG